MCGRTKNRRMIIVGRKRYLDMLIAWQDYYTYGGLPQILHLDSDQSKQEYLMLSSKKCGKSFILSSKKCNFAPR